MRSLTARAFSFQRNASARCTCILSPCHVGWIFFSVGRNAAENTAQHGRARQSTAEYSTLQHIAAYRSISQHSAVLSPGCGVSHLAFTRPED
ncbi:hypothetical protein P153DRAFT_173883 [Dothidotthia symphoricarpi CBS 119687]|uniref:Uncharacterized protein n=1 Tax=Dothidotthia symphoricarpi CBS 119687 TaxID=1392245 RepID=A0A6A6API5_9PLEO|nr:uncharacterized protein P153DRAFT_173883 [Dothidotthia symphoricarpi CBS 119687]KAF2132797.1 hypothetical protein P153DRAFT_173883 [Dothidotthia symphoricarpi CBS 119687]